MDGLDSLAAHLEAEDLVRADAPLLDQRPAAHHDEQLPLAVVPVLTLGDAGSGDVDLVIPGFEMLTLNWPHFAVFRSSVNEPRWSVFIFRGNIAFSFGR